MEYQLNRDFINDFVSAYTVREGLAEESENDIKLNKLKSRQKRRRAQKKAKINAHILAVGGLWD